MRLVPVYRPQPSALHAARAGVAASYCAAIGLCVVLFENPIILSGALAASLAAGLLARVGPEMAAAARLSLPLVLLIALVNPLVYREGATVLLRGGEILGRRLDVTLEAMAYGAVAGFRILALVMAFALYSACVDPDQMLRLFRRFSYRSALSATLATRLVPVLARDARRRADAARCRPQPPGRLAIARAALAGALDRALDAAAALEARGYASARRPAPDHRPWSRHDVSVLLAAVLVAALSVFAAASGIGAVEPYPAFTLDAGPAVIGLALLVPLVAVAPLAGRAARLGVARV
jgi:energy-coupling factor transport system permease protein